MTATALRSAHARYAARLAVLRADEAVLPPVRRAAERIGLAVEGRLERTYARFHPHGEPFATLVLGGGGEPGSVVRVEAYDEEPAARDAREAVLRSEAGWLRVAGIASDPALRSLPALLAGPGRRTVIRYRPYRSCTVRVDAGRRSVYAKVFPDRRGERVHRAGAALWAVAERGELGFAVPRPERYDASSRTLWQSRVAGRPVRAERAPAHRMGLALASLANAALDRPALLAPAAALARSQRLGGALVRSVPALEGDVGELLAQLDRAHAAARPGALVPVHGNPHAGQWLDDGAQLGLVDFDGLALGEPELDAGALLAGLEFEDPARVPVERLRAAFLAGYAEGGPPLDGARMAVHRAHRRLAKALRAATSLRPDGDRRAARHLRRALDEVPA
jgi:Phosphotransferase enzyme family